jgi:hypothetical protein
MFWNVAKYSPKDTVSHSRGPESSAVRLRSGVAWSLLWRGYGLNGPSFEFRNVHWFFSCLKTSVSVLRAKHPYMQWVLETIVLGLKQLSKYACFPYISLWLLQEELHLQTNRFISLTGVLCTYIIYFIIIVFSNTTICFVPQLTCRSWRMH